MEKLENRKNFSIRMKEIDPGKATIVVNANDKVFKICMRSHGSYTPHIAIYHFKRLEYLRCVSGDGQNLTLAKSTR